MKVELCVEVEADSGKELVSELKIVLEMLLTQKPFFSRLAFKREAGLSFLTPSPKGMKPYTKIHAKIQKRELK